MLLETYPSIETEDGKKTTLSVYSMPETRTDKVVVFVHSMGGRYSSHSFYNTSLSLIEQGISAFRFSLYDYGDRARKMHECNLLTHSSDLNTVVKYLRNKEGYSRIGVVGHSIGGPAILYSDLEQIDVIALWDATPPDLITISPHKSPEGDYYYYDSVWNTEHQAFVSNDWPFKVILADKNTPFPETPPSSSTYDICSLLTKPTLVVSAGESIIAYAGKEYYARLNGEKKHVYIPEASHHFDQHSAVLTLIRETVDWFIKFL